MPFQSGSWGPDAQIRSKRRLDYFLKYYRKKKELHPEELKAYWAKYYEQNKEDILAKHTIKPAIYSPKKKAKMAKYYELNREDIRAKQAIYYQKNKLKK